ncbi:MAG: hypothetical protein H0U31_08510 [Chloroflexia bacterium]|nr:hypothetical protein [Chloroflexia bacterium]
MTHDHNPFRTSLLFALIATTVLVLILKLLTGLALAPLAMIAVVVLTIVFALRLRIERMRSIPRHRLGGR